ncbi:MAG: hypothetical protein GEU74_04205 [Nitriliruptorales bacterium]|nr:hypothetical protein [Nitriliruptorales bacterium]
MTETVEQTTAETAPSPRRRGLPDIPGPIDTAVRLWRVLRRMSTALMLLFTLATSTVVATAVPQEPVTAAGAAEWRSGEAGPGAGIARALDALGLFDVFGTWWFAAIVVLLFVSLTGCLVPRYRAFFMIARRPPAAGRNLSRLTHSRSFTTLLAPDEVLAAAAGVMRRRRFRRRVVSDSDRQQLATERGHWREGGSLVFHTAFYLLLAGAVIGKAFGFTGQIALTQGSSFAETRIAYDYAEPGRYWGLEDHRGFVVTLDSFDVSYHPDFTPRDYVADVTIADNGAPVRSGTLRVNHPLRHDGMVLYQAAFGIAPHIVVRAGDRVLLDERVLLRPNGSHTLYSGVAKVSFADPEQQMALDVVLVPAAKMGDDGIPVLSDDPRPTNPVMVADLYFGKLGLERPVPADRFDRSVGKADTAMLRPSGRAELVRGNLTVEFLDLGYWSGLQVSHAPGRWLLLLGGILVLVGLIPSLYSYRRRIWVEVRPDAAGSLVTVAGVALHRKAAFADEFDSVAAAIRRDTGTT